MFFLKKLAGRDSWGWGHHWYSQIRELVHFPGSRTLLKFFSMISSIFIDFLYPTPAWGKRQHQTSIIPRALQLQFVKRRCSSTSPLRGFISCSYPGLKAGWSLTGGVQLRKLSRECSSEIVLTIPACWKMCLGPGGLGNPVYFILELVKVVW